MMTETELKEIKVIKSLCMTDMLFSTRYMFKHQHKRKFVVGDHHKIIADALDKVLRGEITRLIINIAPRFGKTELAVKQFIAAGLAINPAAKFIHLSYSDSLAHSNSEDAREIVQSEYYQKLFPNVKIKTDSNAKKKWTTTAGGGVYATSTGGQITGFGAGAVDQEMTPERREQILAAARLVSPDDPDYIAEENLPATEPGIFGGAIIIDDAIKPDDADSEVRRERINLRFDGTVRSRTNGRFTPIIIIMQRVDPRDLCGYVLEIEPDDWTVIKLPAINEAGNAYNLEPGAALWPFKLNLSELEKLRIANSLVFDRQYMQDASTEKGKLFPISKLLWYDPANTDPHKLAEFRAMAIDPADEGADNLAAPTGLLVGDKIYIPEIIYNVNGSTENEGVCIESLVRNRCEHADIEGNSAWIFFVRAIRAAIEVRSPDCTVRGVKNMTNKHTRILAMSSFIMHHCIFRSDYKNFPEYAAFIKNLTNYNRDQTGINKNAHEDAPDSMAMLAKYFQQNFGHLWEIFVNS